MNTSLVSRDPEIMSGALCFTGTRVPIQNLFDYLEGSSSIEDFLEDFPSVQRAPIVALLDEARDVGIERRLAEYDRSEVKAIDAEEGSPRHGASRGNQGRRQRDPATHLPMTTCRLSI